MTASQDLFAFSFTTRPEAGEDEGNTFDRPDAYTAEQALTLAADFMVHPDNAHVEAVEIRRVGRVADGQSPNLAPVPVNGNATVGWSFESLKFGSDIPLCQIMNGHELAAQTLVDLLNNPETAVIKVCW